MATLLYAGSYGSDDPTRAVLPLLSARGAAEAGHQAEVFLVGEAVYLMRDPIADSLNPVGWPNVGEVLRDVVGKGVNFFV
jgi:predicted peroxiredoxin